MKPHRFNPVAGSAGLCFLILATGFFLDAIDVWNADVTWLAPVFLIVFGIAGVLTTVARSARTEARTDETTEPETEPTS